jgi:hypothetical protein
MTRSMTMMNCEEHMPPVISPTLPTKRDIAVFAMAELRHAMSPTLLNPRGAFESARAFIAEAEKQMPALTAVLSSGLMDD